MFTAVELSATSTMSERALAILLFSLLAADATVQPAPGAGSGSWQLGLGTEPKQPQPQPQPERDNARRPSGALGLRVTLDVDIYTIPMGSAARRMFEDSFRADIAAALGGIHPARVEIASVIGGSVVVTFFILPAPDGTPFPEWSVKLAFGRAGSSIAGASTEDAVVLLRDDTVDARNATVPAPLPPPPVDPAAVTRGQLVIALVTVSVVFILLVAAFAIGARSLNVRMRRRLAEVKMIEREAIHRSRQQAQREATLQQEREKFKMENRKKAVVVSKVKISGGAACEMNLDEDAKDRSTGGGSAVHKKGRPRSGQAAATKQRGNAERIARRPDVSGLWQAHAQSGDAEGEEEYIYLQWGHSGDGTSRMSSRCSASRARLHLYLAGSHIGCCSL